MPEERELQMNKKTELTDVTFEFEADENNPLGCHIHYTLGAASQHDDPLLLKSKQEITKEEQDILDNINKGDSKDEPEIKKEIDMDEQVLKDLNAKIDSLVKANEKAEKENEELKKQLKLDGIQKDIEGFGLENQDEVVKTLELLEDTSEILKAFTFLKEWKEEVIEDENPLDDLKKEAGFDGEAEVVEKSLNERIQEARDSK